MSDGRDDRKDTGELSPIGKVGRTTSRYSREFVATVISLLTTALGVVAALAWNTALTEFFQAAFPESNVARVTALFVYAILVTVIGVIVIIALARLATRIGAEPLEFKYPAPKKED
jgi:uncharacterized membrane protein required for colicin V production